MAMRIEDWTTSEIFDYLILNYLIPEESCFEDWKHDRTDMISILKEHLGE